MCVNGAKASNGDHLTFYKVKDLLLETHYDFRRKQGRAAAAATRRYLRSAARSRS